MCNYRLIRENTIFTSFLWSSLFKRTTRTVNTNAFSCAHKNRNFCGLKLISNPTVSKDSFQLKFWNNKMYVRTTNTLMILEYNIMTQTVYVFEWLKNKASTRYYMTLHLSFYIALFQGFLLRALYNSQLILYHKLNNTKID